MTTCRGAGSWFGCKFEARYDTVPPDDVGHFKGTHAGLIATIQALSKRVYVRDICVRCGKTIERTGT